MKVTPVSTALGADISGIDLSQPLTDKQLSELQSLQEQFEVLFFHHQDLTPLQQQQLAQQFGQLLEYPYVDGYTEAPYVVEIAKLEKDKLNFGGLWHSDSCYLLQPPALTMLYARQLPPLGGDTLFASMTGAYDALSSGMKAMLQNLTAKFSAGQSGGYGVREFRQNKNLDQAPRSSTHPVIRRHPDSGKLSLYVNGAHTSNFTDMTAEESAPILAYLYQHQQRPEFSYRFQWRVGSLAMWDNRTTQHNPLNDYHGHRRVMSRVMVVGEVPLGAH
ncbi:MAG: TauD/TfdA family dioxygenase [Immundisolibacteraceae bacterium]|nr:TauD/TfdA family dioxygenase [Immundisolibacteraceae bacterium]